MSEMDLIPNDYRQGLSVRRLIRYFIVVCVAVLCCIGLARTLLGYLIWRENVQIARLGQQKQVMEQNKARAEELRRRKQVVEQQFVALNKLRDRDSVAIFLRSIDIAYIEGVWLDSLHFMSRDSTQQGAGAINSGITVAPNDALQPLQINRRVEVIGHAINHTRLAEFMRNLGRQPAVANLRLIDTGTRNYTAMQVVDFNLSLRLNEKVPPP